MWECDYPHSDSTWPFAPEQIWDELKLSDISDHDIDRITHLNAMTHFSYDPFSVLGGKEKCTVGALRAGVAGHDVSMRSVDAEHVGHHATGVSDFSVPDYA